MTNTARALIAAAAFAAVIGCGVSAGHAYGNAPWCAVVDLGAGNIQWQCEYYTYEDCVSNVLAGNRGSCNRNPWYRPPPTAPRRPAPQQ